MILATSWTVPNVTTAVGGFHVILSTVFIILIYVVRWGGVLYLFFLLIKALRKYLASGEVRKKKAQVCKSLGEALKENRVRCQMTQEFVAETLGVSRQAVSKWENGISDPSTSNLLALAKLYGVSVEELLKQVQQ